MNTSSKIITLLAIITFLGFTSIQETSTKIGYINSSEITSTLPELKQAEEYFELYRIQQNQIIEESLVKFRKLEDSVYSLTDDSEIEAVMSQLTQLQEKHLVLEQKHQKDLTTKQEELMNPILEKINLEISKLAKQNNYQIVLDSNGQILYAEDNLNMTDALKSNLGM